MGGTTTALVLKLAKTESGGCDISCGSRAGSPVEMAILMSEESLVGERMKGEMCSVTKHCHNGIKFDAIFNFAPEKAGVELGRKYTVSFDGLAGEVTLE